MNRKTIRARQLLLAALTAKAAESTSTAIELREFDKDVTARKQRGYDARDCQLTCTAGKPCCGGCEHAYKHMHRLQPPTLANGGIAPDAKR